MEINKEEKQFILDVIDFYWDQWNIHHKENKKNADISNGLVKKLNLHDVSNNEAFEFRGTTNNVKFADEIEPPTHGYKESKVAVCHNAKKHLCEGNDNTKYCTGRLDFY